MRPAHSNLPHYRAIAKSAWTGDQWGREWRLSWVVVRDATEEAIKWAVYSDDAVPVTGLPTGFEDLPARCGDFEAEFDSFDDAVRWANERAALADQREF
jgi:hypothetical protein